jgi:hypothetical protein
VKKIILLILWFIFVFTIAANAAVPKFKVHVLKDLAPGCNYSINTPVIIDYDGDSDMDILIITKEGLIYFLENLLKN